MAVSASSTALAKLEPFLLLAKSARGAAAAKLISEATAAPGCYVFSELLECDTIRELAASDQYMAEYRMLELFAYGDLAQYQSSPPGTFPTLTQSQLNKLRHLTLVSLALQSRVLPYSLLMQSLGLQGATDASRGEPSSKMSASDIRALEDIIIDAIYTGILSARLDQRRQRVEVESVMGRDVRAEAVGSLSSSLEEWSTTTTRLLATLASRIEQARKSDEDRIKDRSLQEQHLRSMLLRVASAPPGSVGNGLQGYGAGGLTKSTYDRMGSDRLAGDMDMDDESGSARKKKASAGVPGRSKRSRA